jgi:hypothetical protein
VQIGRLEEGQRRLTVEWMRPIAEQLGVKPAELLSDAVLAELCDDVAAETPPAMSIIAGALKARKMCLYRVLSDAVSDAGIASGSIIIADHSESAVMGARSGDVVLAEVRRAMTEETTIILRVLVRPDLLVTNRPRANVAIKLQDEAVDARLCAVVVPNADLPTA